MPASKPASRPVLPPALHYLGDASGQPHVSGIPSRDLSADDLRRLAPHFGLKPAALAALLVSGPFTEAAPANPAANSSADDSEKGDR